MFGYGCCKSDGRGKIKRKPARQFEGKKVDIVERERERERRIERERER